jgi:acetyl esterase/lipase
MDMKFRLLIPVIAMLLIGGCGARETRLLPEAKKGFTTKLARRVVANEPVELPPAGVFNLVNYPTKKGSFPAYLTPNPGDGRKRPAIVWITGGDCNTIGEVWGTEDPRDDQSAAQFRKAGVVMMFPSLRGGNQNPGPQESFLGEVDDVLAAADYLAKQPYVDPKRIYLGGHSTGGTLALLVAESSPRFAAVFSFGPVSEIDGYGSDMFHCEATDREFRPRSPGYWLHSIQSPTFVIEGEGGNATELLKMRRRNRNKKAKFFLVEGVDHFGTLAPINTLLAQKVATGTGPIQLTGDELRAALSRR